MDFDFDRARRRVRVVFGALVDEDEGGFVCEEICSSREIAFELPCEDD